nr:TetR/AcrR family transcriptional regulator [Pseudonocardia endophytica]
MDVEDARTRLLDAAEELFYGRGIQSVGMDEVRGRSGLSIKRVYSLYPGKEQLVEAYLERRDRRWRGRLAAAVEREPDRRRRLLAVFDWLDSWFHEPGFRGCAWINGYGELGAVSEPAARQVRAHKEAFAGYLDRLVADAGLPPALAGRLLLLAEGAMVTAGIFGPGDVAVRAREAAEDLVRAASGG